MSVIRVTTSFNLDIDFEAPPFHRRLFAWLIDLFILFVYILLATKLLSQTWGVRGYDDDSGHNIQAIILVLLLPVFLYHLISEILMGGQSVGKKLMKVQVVNENGGKASISQYIIRWLIRTSDYIILVMFVYADQISIYPKEFFTAFAGAIILLVTDVVLVNSKKNQRLGDILAHTILIKTKQKNSIDDTIFLHIGEGYTPSFPQVMQLSDRDVNALKSILDAAKKHNDYNLAFNASEKIKTHLKIDTSLSPFDFLEILLKDYNYLAAQ
jgi:uncharacterized RDD family membrane protein YckC